MLIYHGFIEVVGPVKGFITKDGINASFVASSLYD